MMTGTVPSYTSTCPVVARRQPCSMLSYICRCKHCRVAPAITQSTDLHCNPISTILTRLSLKTLSTTILVGDKHKKRYHTTMIR